MNFKNTAFFRPPASPKWPQGLILGFSSMIMVAHSNLASLSIVIFILSQKRYPDFCRWFQLLLKLNNMPFSSSLNFAAEKRPPNLDNRTYVKLLARKLSFLSWRECHAKYALNVLVENVRKLSNRNFSFFERALESVTLISKHSEWSWLWWETTICPWKSMVESYTIRSVRMEQFCLQKWLLWAPTFSYLE